MTILLHPSQCVSPFRVRRVENATGLVAVPASGGRLVLLVPPEPIPPVAGRPVPSPRGGRRLFFQSTNGEIPMKRLIDEWRGKSRADKLFLGVAAAVVVAWIVLIIAIVAIGAAGATP